VCFELDVLALATEWFSWATCPVVIASKPPIPNPSPMLVAERSAMRVEREVMGGT
jgi:hypothetical protein